mmetsp:Transcript_18190/g.28556  ORF Transcript_18190/g.28556 Transcript_18190/m.28556 type:complete len:564 (-) Transcript_18190:66-1757(-)
MGLNRADVTHPQRFIVGEVVLVHDPASQRNLVPHHVADAIADTALDLGLDHIGVHCNAAIHGAGDLFDLDAVSGIARNLDHFRHIAAKALVHCDPLRASRRRVAPVALFGGQFQHACLALRVFAVAQIGQPELYRITPGRPRGHVHHDLHRMGGMGVPDRAPPKRAGRLFRIGEAHMHARDGVGRVSRALDRGVIDTVMHDHRLKCGPLHDGLTGDAMIPCHDVAVCRQTHAHLVAKGRAIIAAAHVVLTAPHQFDGAGAVGDDKGQRGLHLIVGGGRGATSEGSASEHGVDPHLVHGQVKDLGQRHMRPGWELRTVMQGDAAVLIGLDGAVQRLHRRVCEQREIERLLHHLRGLIHGGRIVFQHVILGLPFKRGHDLGFDLAAVAGFRVCQVPCDVERITRLHRSPCVFGIDGDGGVVGQGGRADKALDLFCRTVVKAGHQTAGLRRAGQHGHHLVRQMHVHGEHRGAVALDLAVEAPDIRVANQPPLIRRFQRWFGRGVQLRRSRDEVPQWRVCAYAGDHSIHDIERAGIDPKGLRGSVKEHGPRCGTCRAVLHERIGHGG